MLADLGWFCLPKGAQKVVDSPGDDDDDQAIVKPLVSHERFIR